MNDRIKAVAVTDKGIALLAAIEAGLIPKTEDKYDTEPFEKFWEIYSEKSLRNFEKRLEQANETTKKPQAEGLEIKDEISIDSELHPYMLRVDVDLARFLAKTGISMALLSLILSAISLIMR